MKSAGALLLVLLLAGALVPAVAAAASAPVAPLHAPSGGEVFALAAMSRASSSFYASPNPDDVGIGTTFYASGLCQATACNYTYVGLPPGCASANSAQLPCTPTATGSYNVSATATAVCALVCLQWSGATILVVNPAVSITSLTASPSEVDVGHTVQLTMVISGGSSPFTYSWSGLPAGCASADTATLSCTPTATGTPSILGTVHDSPGAGASSSVSLTVVSALTVTSFSVNPSQSGLGSSVTFTVTVLGGVPPLSYTYTGLPSGCASVNSSSFSCVPTTAGTSNVTASVTDAQGVQSTGMTTLTIDSGPSITGASWAPTTVELGQASTLTVTASGGTAPYVYSYANLPAGCASSNSATLSCTPTQNGTFAVGIKVVDANQLASTATATLTVFSQIGVTFTANRTSGVAPLEVAFRSHVTGGTTPVTYAWTFGDGGTSTQANPSHWFLSVGNFTVGLKVQDTTGATASYSSKLLVSSSGGTSYSLVVLVTPSACPAVTVGTLSASSGSQLQLPAGAYSIVAAPCSGQSFSAWGTTGAASVMNTSQSSSVLQVSGAGTLTATYLVGGGPPPGGHARGVYLSPLVRTVLLVVALVVAVWGLVYLARRRTIQKSRRKPTGPGLPPAGGPGAGSPSRPNPGDVRYPTSPFPMAARVSPPPPGIDSRSNSSLRNYRSEVDRTATVTTNDSRRGTNPAQPKTAGSWYRPDRQSVPRLTESWNPSPVLKGTYLGAGSTSAASPPSTPPANSTESVASSTPAAVPSRRIDDLGPAPVRLPPPPPPPAPAPKPGSPVSSDPPRATGGGASSNGGVEAQIRQMVDELKSGYRDLPPSSDIQKRGTEHIQRAVDMLRAHRYGGAQIELNRAAALLRERSPARPRSPPSAAPQMPSR